MKWIQTLKSTFAQISSTTPRPTRKIMDELTISKVFNLKTEGLDSIMSFCKLNGIFKFPNQFIREQLKTFFVQMEDILKLFTTSFLIQELNLICSVFCQIPKSKGEIGTIQMPAYLKTQDETEIYLNDEINEYKILHTINPRVEYFICLKAHDIWIHYFPVPSQSVTTKLILHFGLIPYHPLEQIKSFFTIQSKPLWFW